MLGLMERGIDVVTGAFGNTGSAIATRLRTAGRSVRTLTNHAPADSGDIDVHPLAFDDPVQLAAAFDGAATFYNTYWMRMGSGGRYDVAVARSRLLIEAASRAGVQRIVQFSVVKPSCDSPYPYFRAKAEVEAIVAGTGIPAAIIRPAVIFGGENVLVDNLAYLLRRSPLFLVPGDGQYRVRPVHVDDVADLCVAAGRRHDDEVHDAVGPERPTFDELITTVGDAIGCSTRILHAPPWLVLGAGRLLGAITRRQLLNRAELMSTMDGLADSDAPAIGPTSLSSWIAEHADTLGRSRPR